MAKQKEFVSYLVENMEMLGDVNARAMFGGYGIFLNGLMFGLRRECPLFKS
jgi:DNA transformation protein